LSARRLLDERGVLIGLVVVALIFGALIGPQFFRAANVELMARQTVIVCVAALGMTMVIVSGGIDLSVGSVVALSTVVVALMLRAGTGPALAAAGAVAAGALCGALNGLLITRLQVVPFIVTLGTMLLVRGAAKGLAGERRIEAPVSWLNDLLRTAQDGGGWLLPSGIWITAALAIVVAFTLRYTRFGRHLFAIGSNERTARLCGVRIKLCKWAVYTIAAGMAGLAGVMEFAKLSVGDPTVALGLELDVIAAVIIGGGSLLGGKGSVVGTIAGAAIMSIIQIGCSQQGLPNWVQEIVTAPSSLEQSHWIDGEADLHETHAPQRTWRTQAKSPFPSKILPPCRPCPLWWRVNVMIIRDIEVLDLRFPTSRTHAGTDAVHVDPDYSAAYVVLKTDAGIEGHGLTFTIGRGNEVVVAAIEAFRHLVVGARLDAIASDFAGFWRRLASDSQLRWLGPEKGVIHLALAAIVNAVWDLYAKVEQKPLWKLLADMPPRQLVSCIDFRYITDALTAEEAIELLERHSRTKADREADLLRNGYPAYTTSVGWMGYTDDAIRALCPRRSRRGGRISK